MHPKAPAPISTCYRPADDCDEKTGSRAELVGDEHRNTGRQFRLGKVFDRVRGECRGPQAHTYKKGDSQKQADYLDDPAADSTCDGINLISDIIAPGIVTVGEGAAE